MARRAFVAALVAAAAVGCARRAAVIPAPPPPSPAAVLPAGPVTEIGGAALATNADRSRLLLERLDARLVVFRVDPAAAAALDAVRVGDPVLLTFVNDGAGGGDLVRAVRPGTPGVLASGGTAGRLPFGLVAGTPLAGFLQEGYNPTAARLAWILNQGGAVDPGLVFTPSQVVLVAPPRQPLPPPGPAAGKRGTFSVIAPVATPVPEVAEEDERAAARRRRRQRTVSPEDLEPSPIPTPRPLASPS